MSAFDLIAELDSQAKGSSETAGQVAAGRRTCNEMKSHEYDQFVRPVRRRMWLVIALILAWGAGWFLVHAIAKGQHDAAVHAR